MLLGVNTWNHVPWSDELHAWGLTLGSPGFVDLFRNLHYDGHPGLWHSLLWIASAVSPSPVAMQITHFLLAAATIAVITAWAPFRPIEKALLLANYFLIHEYTVLARNYGIGLLLALIYARLRTARAVRPMLVGLILGAMGNANVYAFVLSGLLALEYAWTGLIATRRLAEAGFARVAAGAVLYAALMLLAVATVWPQPDGAHFAQQPTAAEMRDPIRFGLQFLRALVPPFLPVDFSFPESFAFPSNIYDNGKRVWVCLALAPLILGALGWIFRGRPSALAVILATALVATGFSFVVYPAAIRHLGIVFIAFVTMLWVTRAEGVASSAARAPVLALLLLGAIGGGVALAGQWMRPFAINDQVVRWLRANDLGDAALVGYPDIRTEAIAILLGRPYYALDCQCEARFARFDNRRDDFTEAMIPDRLATAVRLYQPRPIVLLAGDPLPEAQRAEIQAMGLVLTERVALTGAERDQAMTIFTVAPLTAASGIDAPGKR